MAVRTSTQSGNFNATSTWGGAAVPVDGDQFVVSAGHIVTVSDDRRPTNGYHDSTIYGKLHITSTGKLRMNGVLTVDMNTGATKHFVSGDSASGAFFRMDNAAVLEIRGTNSDIHYLRINNEQWVWVELDGTNPNSKTTLSSNVSIASDSIPVVSSSGFAAGDWISSFVEAENIDDWEIQGYCRQEGWKIHDVSSNTIYVKDFVGPESEILFVNSTQIRVQNASLFRVGRKIIFGTGSNRNTKTITNINTTTNIITLNSSVTGSVVGEKIYYTGVDKYHGLGDSVQKVATPLLADANSGQNQITVASTAGMTVGTRIFIEANNPSDTSWDYEMVYTISGINGNTITLTDNLGNNRKEGAWIAIYDRDTKVVSTSVGDSAQRPFIYFIHNTSSTMYYRRYRIRNVLFEGIGSNSSNSTWYRGIGLNGYCSYENNSYGEFASSFEGCTFRPNNRGNNACTYSRDWHQGIYRNNIFYDGALNFWGYSGGNSRNFMFNISARANYSCMHNDGMYGVDHSIEYNLFSRSEDYGIFLYHDEEGSSSFRQNYVTYHNNRPLYTFYNSNNQVIQNCYIDGFRYWPYIGIRGGDQIFLNCYLGNIWDATGESYAVSGTYISDQDQKRPFRSAATPSLCVSVNHNWEKDKIAEWGGYSWREWDRTENAWFTRRTLNTGALSGFVEGTYVPAGSTVYIGAEIKMSSGFSGNIPYLVAYNLQGYYGATDGTPGRGSSGSSQDSYATGFQEVLGFTSACLTDYERITLTVQPQNYDYYLNFSIYSNSTNAANNDEGWYQKPLEVYVSNRSPIVSKNTLTYNNTKLGEGNSANERKVRIGGRIK